MESRIIPYPTQCLQIAKFSNLSVDVIKVQHLLLLDVKNRATCQLLFQYFEIISVSVCLHEGAESS